MERPVDHVVKTEIQPNGEILLFYVDENGDNEEGVLTTVQNIESDSIELQQVGHTSNINPIKHTGVEDGWTDDETNRLLIFYIDNKRPFISGTTKREHLWTVACKTMIIGKNPTACEAKLKSLKESYLEGCWFEKNGISTMVPFQELCHQAFHDDNNAKFHIEIIEPGIQDIQAAPVPVENIPVLNTIINTKAPADEKVKLLLELYLKHKKNFQREYNKRDLWDTIAREIGEDDGIYWQKRFLNYKQHYVNLIAKRESGGSVFWPYMELFDKIFEDDTEFKKKFVCLNSKTEIIKKIPTEWNDTEVTVLAKYCYDCFDEFLDDTIPKNFLWTEIGRLLDRPPDLCKIKYNQLKNQHYNKYIEGGYEIRERKPSQIILDNIIYKEVEMQLKSEKTMPIDVWNNDNIDELVKFMYQNIEMFKDHVCHFVCWGAIAKKMRKDVKSCKKQWEDLVILYRNILEDKKEDPGLQIDWRFIELFDRIYDYGMDTGLLNGYEKLHKPKEEKFSDKEKVQNGTDDENELYDEHDDKDSKHGGDSKAFKILEYYQKNKDKFTSPHRNKHSLWEILAKQIGISATQCAHRLRNLKQVYTGYVQREINKPEMPIFWPYYTLCKKVFGYRAIKAKLKNSKQDSNVLEEWSAKEIKMLLNYLAQNISKVDDSEDLSVWSGLAKEIGKSEQACREKFLELRKSYRKLKTKITRHPNVKISWKYFGLLDNIYGEKVIGAYDGGSEDSPQDMEVEQLEEWMEEDKSQQDDDDYQCIIILPEGQDVSSIDDTSQITLKNDIITDTQIEVETKPALKWTKQLKKLLLVSYIKYIRAHKGNRINSNEMWKEIGVQIDKKPIICKKMFTKLKANYMKSKDDTNAKKTIIKKLLERILKLKPKFEKIYKNNANKEAKVFKDVNIANDSVLKALQYYLQHIEEFSSPKFDKKCLWQELANSVNEPVSRVFNKINYLKQVFNAENTCEVAEFDDIIKEIISRDMIRNVDDNKIITENFVDTPWSNEEVKQLLEWYLSNLEKFKNPKFVRKYLWMEVSQLLKKSPLGCSKKMTEIRMQYKTMVNETPAHLDTWEFYDLCQKIYGTGKKVTGVNVTI
ncbi:hypothetical protein K1T71_013294 [Dendrolimus kikuchii]|uniref:Uncharacterized protein n=1 Tax=Dendrolimus kikuchii TaxID=765133 RepID=A0ACC1CHM4_9NEOP|nr:hypothetical protein K1T71_013294 [Dendrolimus kikuchii]